MDRYRLDSYTEGLFGGDLHVKRLLSLSDCVEGVLNSATLGIHAIGRGLAAANGLSQKHAIKQVDRFIGNKNFIVKALAPTWVRHVIGEATQITVNIDWTDFDSDGHTMLVIAAQTGRGRATPLIWKTVNKNALKDRTRDYEIELLDELKIASPKGCRYTVVADRGFASLELLAYLEENGFDYVIRFKKNTIITSSESVSKNADEWLAKSSGTMLLRDARLTEQRFPISSILITKDPDMKDCWLVVSNLKRINTRQLKIDYGQRFTIEEMFRDVKDLRYGMGMSWTRISSPERRDRLFFIAAIAIALLTLLGEAGESIGMDRSLKANTVTRRTLSLVRQGIIWYDALPNMPAERLVPLMRRFDELLRASLIYGPINAIYV